tara:strand:+ start:135 stop:374 length:240 start_codon:yes stop_codon:yes gene_type:complete
MLAACGPYFQWGFGRQVAVKDRQYWHRAGQKILIPEDADLGAAAQRFLNCPNFTIWKKSKSVQTDWQKRRQNQAQWRYS